MRIFIGVPDQTGQQKTTRLQISNCQDTTQLMRQISKQLNINKNAFIFLVKNQIVNLRVLQNWPLSIYGVKNGSWIILKENLLYSKRQLSNSPTVQLEKIDEGRQDVDGLQSESLSIESPFGSSFTTSKEETNYQEYFDHELQKMLSLVRENKLDRVSHLLKEENGEIQDQQKRDEVTVKKNAYILNQIGECGRNALHWAIHNQNLQMVTFLLLKYCDPTVLTIDQYTPLQLAVVFRNLQLAQLLLTQPKVDPNTVTAHGTSLHLAVHNTSIPMIHLLLDNGANIDQVNNDGKRPVQVCENSQIKAIFEDQQKKLKLRFIKPNITKGNILKVSSLTWRSKQRQLMVNPFKGDLTIMKDNNIVDYKIRVGSIREVERITEKAWLMDGKLHYFKIVYTIQSQEEKLIFAIKHVPILGRWLDALDLARVYCTNQKWVTKIQKQMQLIEVLDDTKNEIKVHKRQVDMKKLQSPTKRYSIMDMKVASENQQSQKEKQSNNTQNNLNKQQFPHVHFEIDQPFGTRSFISSSQSTDLRQSEILLGSVLMEKNFETMSSISTQRHTVMGTSYTKNQLSDHDFSLIPDKLTSNFRKKSFDLVKVSESQIQQKATFSDFDFIKQLGAGAFGQVYLTKHRKSQRTFAMKILNKRKLMSKKQLKYAVSETNILKRIEHPFIICLHYSFQTRSNLYLALDYCPNEDLSEILCEKQRFTEMTARFVIAQCILAIEYIHKQKIIYRDLKPENILLGKDGYVKLIDFGLSKENNFAMSFCGSPAYLSPQMLDKKGHSFPTDIYGLGCLLYEMVIGQPPYYDENLEQMFDNIKTARLKFPGFLTKEIKSLISRMLERDVTKRIGATNMKELKSHQFFNGLQWDKLLKKQLTVPKEVFPESAENQYFKLQSQQIIRYADQDYSDSLMLNKIKGFSFSRSCNKE